MAWGADGKLLVQQQVMTKGKTPGPAKLFGLVSAFGRNQGQVTLPVVRVTVQEGAGPKLEAVVRNGHWFAPIEAGTTAWDDAAALRDNSLVHVYPGVRLRGYSAAGRLVYDSDRDAHTMAECHPGGASIAVCPQVEWKYNPVR